MDGRDVEFGLWLFHALCDLWFDTLLAQCAMILYLWSEEAIGYCVGGYLDGWMILRFVVDRLDSMYTCCIPLKSSNPLQSIVLEMRHDFAVPSNPRRYVDRARWFADAKT
jgi:hypothetical protein